MAKRYDEMMYGPDTCSTRGVLVRYNYRYLKETEFRGQTLFNIIKPYLKPGDQFLDMNCGYSSLARPLLQAGYDILGFDMNPTPIRYLKKHFPKGQWQQISHENANFKGFSVLLLLGFSISSYGTSFLASLSRLLDSNKPRVVVAEVYRGPEVSWFSVLSSIALNYLKGKPVSFRALTMLPYRVAYKEALRLLAKNGYRQSTSAEYDAKMSVASIRIYSVWERLT